MIEIMAVDQCGGFSFLICRYPSWISLEKALGQLAKIIGHVVSGKLIFIWVGRPLITKAVIPGLLVITKFFVGVIWLDTVFT